MKSTFLATGMGFVYRVGDDADPDLLTIEVTNLRQRNGSTYALLTTSTTIATARRIPNSDRVLNAEIWLLSDRQRAEYAQSLARLIPAPPGAKALDFESILEELAQRVIESENAPVSVVRLNAATRPPKTTQPFLVEAIVPENRATILYGAGGVGKSILAAALAVSVQTGESLMGLGVKQAEVLYLDWETDEHDILDRIEAASKAMGRPTPPEIRYSALVRPIEDRVAPLARYVAEEGIGFVIIDSVGMAMSTARDGSDASDTAIRFFRALRALNTAVLAIDHVSGDDMRRGRAGAAKPYGSVYKWNSARNAFELRERREQDASGKHLVLKHRKTNVGPRMADLNFTLLWDETTGEARFTPEKVLPPVIRPLTEQIIDVLSVGPANPRQIADLLSDDDVAIGEIDVRRELKGLMSQGKVTSLSDGSIRLVPKADDEVESGLIPE